MTERIIQTKEFTILQQRITVTYALEANVGNNNIIIGHNYKYNEGARASPGETLQYQSTTKPYLQGYALYILMMRIRTQSPERQYHRIWKPGIENHVARADDLDISHNAREEILLNIAA